MIEFNEEILFYAFRYALGRSTYAVSDVVEVITNNWNKLSYSSQYLIHKEIKVAIERNEYGMEMDKLQWERVLQFPVKKEK